MFKKKLKKALTCLLIALFSVLNIVPIGFCSTVKTSIHTQAKPTLRAINQRHMDLKLEGDIAISKRNPKISLSLRDSDVKQVLRMFADKAGLNIIFHSSIDGGSVSSSSSSSGTASNPAPISSAPSQDNSKSDTSANSQSSTPDTAAGGSSLTAP